MVYRFRCDACEAAQRNLPALTTFFDKRLKFRAHDSGRLH